MKRRALETEDEDGVVKWMKLLNDTRLLFLNFILLISMAITSVYFYKETNRKMDAVQSDLSQVKHQNELIISNSTKQQTEITEIKESIKRSQPQSQTDTND